MTPEREADWRRWAETVRKHLSPDSDIEWVPAALLECLDGLASLRAQLADREREVERLRGTLATEAAERERVRDLGATMQRERDEARAEVAMLRDWFDALAAQAGEG
jgi:hypothetical protein